MDAVGSSRHTALRRRTGQWHSLAPSRALGRPRTHQAARRKRLPSSCESRPWVGPRRSPLGPAHRPERCRRRARPESPSGAPACQSSRRACRAAHRLRRCPGTVQKTPTPDRGRSCPRISTARSRPNENACGRGTALAQGWSGCIEATVRRTYLGAWQAVEACEDDHVRVAATRGPPLLAIQDHGVAVQPCRRSQVSQGRSCLDRTARSIIRVLAASPQS